MKRDNVFQMSRAVSGSLVPVLSEDSPICLSTLRAWAFHVNVVFIDMICLYNKILAQGSFASDSPSQ